MRALERPVRTRGAAAGETSRRVAAVRFVRHYAEMVVAMLVGMMVLLPAWGLAVGLLGEPGWAGLVEVDLLAMVVAMTVPMAAWMRWRGHAARPVAEMSLAMAAGFVVLLPLLWSGLMGESTVVLLGHVLMLLFMLAAMLLRPAEYVGRCER